MKLTDSKEILRLFKEVGFDWYGQYTKQDVLDFVAWLEDHNDIKAEAWTRTSTNNIPYDLEELFLEFLNYQGFIEEVEEERTNFLYNQDHFLNKEYLRNVL